MAWYRARFLFLLTVSILTVPPQVRAQSLGNAGTIQGTVLDPDGLAIADAAVTIRNRITGFTSTAKSGADGTFRLLNLPPNTYHLDVKVDGFAEFSQDVTLRSSVPVVISAKLTLATAATEVTVEGAGVHMVELSSSAHIDVDRGQFTKLPSGDPGSGLSQIITNSTGGVSADANGFFHPLGDHGQVSFVVDGQPITDQQSKIFSTQLPASAIQSMEVTTGAPDAEFGDKSSLVAQITTRSGLGAKKMFGNADARYGTFGAVTGSVGLGFGSEKFGNFLAIDGVRSGRFLDTPEVAPFHAIGNNQTIFDRMDFQPKPTDVFHLNLFMARNWIQIPNSYDQLGQDQRQRVLTWSVAPGYQHTFNARTLLTVNPYIRKDQFNFYGSRNPLADTPFTTSQQRQLLNYGFKSDIAGVRGHHSFKAGIDLKQTRLLERFGFAVTDPGYNPVCINATGDSAGPSSLTDPSRCAGLGLTANPDLQAGLVRYDLTRGGSRFAFQGARNINQYALFFQDAITLGHLMLNFGVRGDAYRGITSDSALSPRAGAAYNIKKTGTVLRFAFSRTFETPFNENLILSSATGTGGLAENVFGNSGVSAIHAGRRNQFNTGFQQAIGHWLLLDADYFWKFTRNAYDFNILLNTTITFPIAWHNSKIDGFTGRLSTTNLHGFQAYWTFGHTRARYFPPETGGLLGNPPDGVFRIDHDQAFQSTVNARYQRPKNAEWVSLTWRYDSGLVVSGVPDVAAALALTAAQQASIGFSCDGTFATYTTPVTSCSGTGKSKLVVLPQAGAGNDDHNPARVEPRNVFNLGIGTDNIFHREGHKRWVASFEITNLTNRVALYNFLSTFSGTHFLSPRAMTGHIGFVF